MTTLLDILKKDSKGTFHWLEAANDFETALIPVYLTSMEDRHARERTLTENVSPHGARVISKRSWRPSEDSLTYDCVNSDLKSSSTSSTCGVGVLASMREGVCSSR
jgi:hypothetical protein